MDGKRPIVSSVHGMVAAAHPLAASAGARILAMGGNAFDSDIWLVKGVSKQATSTSALLCVPF